MINQEEARLEAQEGRVTPIESGRGKVEMPSAVMRELTHNGLFARFKNKIESAIKFRYDYGECASCNRGYFALLFKDEEQPKFCYHCGAEMPRLEMQSQ